MRNGKYSRRRTSKKILTVLVAMVLVIGCAVGGTLAWLTAKTETVTNTFTVGDIGTLTLKEKDLEVNADTTNTYTIVPGVNITKDPKVSYSRPTDNPVDVYVFVEVSATGWTLADNEYSIKNGDTKLLSWTVGSEWHALDGYTGVYYKEVAAGASLNEVEVISDSTITVSEAITKDNVAEVAKAAGDITFTAYAIQKDGFADAAAAWAKVK